MKVVFCVYGYSPDVERLQPWLTVHEVASGLLSQGWEVHLITDVDTRPSLGGLISHRARTMRPSNALEIIRILDEIKPDRIVVLSTPLNLLSRSWYRNANCKLYAFLSYPFYTRFEIYRALRHLELKDLITFGRHALIPRFLWARTLRKYFSGVIAQSARTANRVAVAAGPLVKPYALKAGIDREFWKPAGNEVEEGREGVRFLYLGSAKAIRGFNVLLESYAKLVGEKTELHILARGASEEEETAIREAVERKVGNLNDSVSIKGGWMDRDMLRQEIRDSDVVVLPFVLVPSELPVSVMECIACGTPVISTDIDGLPEAVGKAGRIVGAGDARELAQVLREIVENPSMLDKMIKECSNVRNQMNQWKSVADEWRKTLER